MTSEPRDGKRTYRIAIALTLCMFAFWGLAQQLYYTLLPSFSRALALAESQEQLASWTLCFGYCLMALPAALITRNFGYKSGVVFGLGTFSVGMFLLYPAATQHAFAWLLCAAVVIGSGLAILEVSAQPMVVFLGGRENAVRRLNLAQAVNPIGVVGGFMLGQYMLTTSAAHPVVYVANWLAMPLYFIGGGVLLFAFLVDKTNFPPLAIARATNDVPTVKTFGPLFRNRGFMLGVGAQFLSAITQSVLWAFTVRYVLTEVSSIGLAAANQVLLWNVVAFAVGRFVGTALMFRIRPALVLALFAVGGALCAATAALTHGFFGVECLVGASFFVSILFPTIFASSIRDLGNGAKTASAMLLFAAAGSPLVLALLDAVTTPATVPYVMVIPSLCFVAIAAFALHLRRCEAASR